MKEQRRVLQVVIPIMLASLVVSAVLEFSTPIFKEDCRQWAELHGKNEV